MHFRSCLRKRLSSVGCSVALVTGLLFASNEATAQSLHFNVLHEFPAPGAVRPVDALLQATDGNFYGTTQTGGAFNAGTVFKITTAGTLTVLHAFT